MCGEKSQKEYFPCGAKKIAHSSADIATQWGWVRPDIPFCRSLFSLLSSGWFVIAICGSILVQGIS